MDPIVRVSWWQDSKISMVMMMGGDCDGLTPTLHGISISDRGLRQYRYQIANTGNTLCLSIILMIVRSKQNQRTQIHQENNKYAERPKPGKKNSSLYTIQSCKYVLVKRVIVQIAGKNM